MRVSPGRTGGFESCAAQTSRVESLTRLQSFGHLKVADRAIAFPRANPQLPSVGPLTEPLSCVDGVTRAEKHLTR